MSFRVGNELGGPKDDLVDLGAMGGVGFRHFGIGAACRGHVTARKSRKKFLLGEIKESRRGGMCVFHEFGAQAVVELLRDPIVVSRVVIFAQCRKAVAPRVSGRRIVKSESCFQVGFDDVGGRRKNVGQEVFAQDDLTVKLSADLQRLQRKVCGAEHDDASGHQHRTRKP